MDVWGERLYGMWQRGPQFPPMSFRRGSKRSSKGTKQETIHFHADRRRPGLVSRDVFNLEHDRGRKKNDEKETDVDFGDMDEEFGVMGYEAGAHFAEVQTSMADVDLIHGQTIHANIDTMLDAIYATMTSAEHEKYQGVKKDTVANKKFIISMYQFNYYFRTFRNYLPTKKKMPQPTSKVDPSMQKG